MSTDMLPPVASSTDESDAALDSRKPAIRKPGLFRYLWLILIIGAASAAVAFPALLSSRDDAPRLTHTVKRGNLVVTVTEQGTLESSQNTEIKCKVRGFSTVNWVVPSGTIVEPGDELVRLDTKIIEETVSLGKTNSHIARATLEKSKAEVAKSEIAVQAYLEGRYRSQLQTLQKELTIAESTLETAKKMHEHAKELFQQGFVTALEVEGNAFTVTQAELEMEVKKTELDVLQRFTKEMALETLNGNLIANRSKLQADQAGLKMDEARRDRAIEELKSCVVTAERGGLVIYPSAAAWKNTPDIAEGATVRKDQVLLLMPDLDQMQVKVGIHESIIDRMRPGLAAKVTLPDRTLDAEVSTVATVTKPAGWWTGNVVKYDTVIKLPSVEGLKPGMSAEVQIILDRHENVITVPIASVVETEQGAFCWVKTNRGVKKRPVRLGDSNDIFVVVEAGLNEGEVVVLDAESFDRDGEADPAVPASSVVAQDKATRVEVAVEDDAPQSSRADVD